MEPVEWRELMEEPAAGHGCGRTASADPNVEGRWVSLDTNDAQADAFMRRGGFAVVDTAYGSTLGSKYGARDAGMTAHRGVLSGDEYVDDAAVRAEVERVLGFTYDDVHAVYRQGRLSAEQGELRARIDARLLALSRAGANMFQLGEVLGFKTTPGTMHRAFKNALARARAASPDQTERRA